MKNPDKCAEKYCRNPVFVSVLGIPLCEKHWNEHLEHAFKTAAAMIFGEREKP